MSDQEKGPGSSLFSEQAAVHLVGAAGALHGLGLCTTKCTASAPGRATRRDSRSSIRAISERTADARGAARSADQGVAGISSSSMPRCAAAEQAARRKAQDQSKVNRRADAQDSGAQRSFSGSAQPHRRADLRRSKSPTAKAARIRCASRSTSSRPKPTRSSCPGGAREAGNEFRPDGPAAPGLEGREGRAAAEATSK